MVQLRYIPAEGEPGETLTEVFTAEQDPSLATPGGYRYDISEALAVAKQFALPEDDARRVLAMGHTVPPLEEAARAAFPTTFAGAWIDPLNARFVMQFTEEAPRSAEAVSQDHPHHAQMDPATAAHSLLELEAALAVLSASSELLQSMGVHGSGVDVRRNTLFVESSAPAGALRATVDDLASGLPVEVREAEPPRDYYTWGANLDNCPVNWTKCNPLRGSTVFHRAGSGTSSPDCTQGFFARSRSSGHRRMLTAGHCGGTGVPTTYYHYNVLVGGVAIEDNCTRDCRVDAQAHVVENGWQMGPYIMHHLSAFDEAYPIEGVWRGGDLTQGTVLCVTGAYSGLQVSLADTSCRPVNNPNFSTTVDGRNFYNLIRLDTPCGTNTDSGAPLYSGYTSYGLLKGGNPDGCTFSQIRHVEQALNLTVQEF